MDLKAIVLLMLGCAIAYISYRNRALGAAIGVGVAVATLASVLLSGNDRDGKGGGNPPGQ